MKEYQKLIGSIIIASAILISGVLISNSIRTAGLDIGGRIGAAIEIASKQ